MYLVRLPNLLMDWLSTAKYRPMQLYSDVLLIATQLSSSEKLAHCTPFRIYEKTN